MRCAARFSEEQQLLHQDKDEHDFQAIPIVALACQCGMPNAVVGAVRIYQSQPGLWYGGRLCVAADYRRHSMIGTALINEAVSRAGTSAVSASWPPFSSPMKTIFSACIGARLSTSNCMANRMR
ncbi:MSMEG_0567/Sll0786 family nitrogen starvation N-acetyltransferase [Halopseudomonas pachastrellae]|nr:MSMEG_0567/Sll0786 family nitrogen starvation N-acetyltransferase [Halopseudomonas pachastrellae]